MVLIAKFHYSFLLSKGPKHTSLEEKDDCLLIALPCWSSTCMSAVIFYVGHTCAVLLFTSREPFKNFAVSVEFYHILFKAVFF